MKYFILSILCSTLYTAALAGIETVKPPSQKYCQSIAQELKQNLGYSIHIKNSHAIFNALSYDLQGKQCLVVGKLTPKERQKIGVGALASQLEVGLKQAGFESTFDTKRFAADSPLGSQFALVREKTLWALVSVRQSEFSISFFMKKAS